MQHRDIVEDSAGMDGPSSRWHAISPSKIIVTGLGRKS
jgi:hypothetical protein